MYCKIGSFSLLFLFVNFFSGTAFATDINGYDVDFEAYAGSSYDSNVSIDALDATSRLGDHATNTGFKFGVEKDYSEKWSTNVGISVSDISYDTNSAFDLTTKLATANVAYDLPKKVKVGMGVYFASTDLDGATFLEMTQFNPNISWFASKSNYFRFTLSSSSKTFDGRPLRDSTNTAFGADWYYFLSGSKNFFSLGYDFKKESAEDKIYDYKSHNMKFSWTRKFQLYGNASKLKAGIKTENRTYSDPASGGSVARKDDRIKGFAEYEVELFSKGFVNLEYEGSNNNSNVITQTYNQSVITMSLGVKL